ncbi:hypothetical protein ACUZIS_004482 [Enterobacter hormaechei]
MPGQGQGGNNHPWLIGSLTCPGCAIVALPRDAAAVAAGENLLQ